MSYSERVRLVLAAAIQASVRVALGRRISEADTVELAQHGTLATLFGRLDTRFRVTRGDEEVARDTDFQTELAVKEVLWELGGLGPVERQRLIAQAISARREQIAQEKLVEGRTSSLRRMINDMDRRAPALRRFLRNAHRLLSEQERQLTAHLPQAEATRSLEALYRIYEHHLKRAWDLDVTPFRGHRG